MAKYEAFMWSNRTKLFFHIVQVILVHVAIGLSTPRLFMKNQPRTRATTIALGMGAKSLMIIFYQIGTENVGFLKKWYSRKANAILNSLEIVFWAAVVFLLIQANIARCVGITCILSWITVGVAIVITMMDVVVATASIVEFRAYRKVPPPIEGQRPVEQSAPGRAWREEYHDLEQLRPAYEQKP